MQDKCSQCVDLRYHSRRPVVSGIKSSWFMAALCAAVVVAAVVFVTSMETNVTFWQVFSSHPVLVLSAFCFVALLFMLIVEGHEYLWNNVFGSRVYQFEDREGLLHIHPDWPFDIPKQKFSSDPVVFQTRIGGWFRKNRIWNRPSQNVCWTEIYSWTGYDLVLTDSDGCRFRGSVRDMLYVVREHNGLEILVSDCKWAEKARDLLIKGILDAIDFARVQKSGARSKPAQEMRVVLEKVLDDVDKESGTYGFGRLVKRIDDARRQQVKVAS